jgi:carbon storage regulator
MLILSRKVGESLVIDDSIVVRIVEIRGSSIRIGIEASDEVVILRSELVGTPPEPDLADSIR